MVSRFTSLVLAGLLLVATNFAAAGADRSIVVASTTSTQDSGLFGYLLPIFKQKTGIEVKVIAQGTGQALDTARRGDADVVFVHAKPQEEKFLAEGYGVKRFDVLIAAPFKGLGDTQEVTDVVDQHVKAAEAFFDIAH